MALIKRSSQPAAVLGTGTAATDPVIAVEVPALVEFLTLDGWEDGAVRKLGTFTVFFEDGFFRAWVNNKDARQSGCVSAVSLAGLLEVLDRKLREDSIEWRKSRPDPRRGGRGG